MPVGDFTAFRGATTSSSEEFAQFDTNNCVAVLDTVSNECTSELVSSVPLIALMNTY